MVECINNNSYPDLVIEVLSSATLQKGQMIRINPLGLAGDEESLRVSAQRQPGTKSASQQYNTAPDGFTYFGTLADVYESDINGEEEDLMPSQDHGQSPSEGIIVNDIVIPPRNPQGAE